MKIYYFIIISLILSVLLLVLNSPLFKILFSIIWALTTIVVLISGLHYTQKFKFLQLHLKEIIKSLKVNNTSKNSINSFEALTMSMAEKIGVGSISGIAIAIYLGGVGTIFWICLFTIICSINTYVEAYLGIKYQSNSKDVSYGGPSYYIKKALHNNKLSKLYAFLIIISYSGIFLAVQANTITKSINYAFNINPIIITIILILSIVLILYKGIKKVSTVSSILVPFMIITYLSIGLIIVIFNIEKLPQIITNIISSAFTLKGGLSALIYPITIGLQRALFATESGLGTTAIASSLTKEDPHKQGLSAILTVYITTFIVCLSTAFIILTTNYTDITFSNLNGIELTLYAFNYHLKDFGTIILTIIIVLFAYTTIISGYFFGEINLKIFSQKPPKRIFKLFVLIIITLGCLMTPTIIWNLVDLLVASLTIINIYSMLKITK